MPIQPLPRIVAHRGASAYTPENTLAAFSLATDMGAEFFELDCSLTRDGEVVVMHDARVDRTTSGSGETIHFDLAALQELDAGSWKDARFADERVPTLEQALQLAVERDVGVYVEVKSWEKESSLLLRWLRNKALPPRVLDTIATSAPEALKLVRAVLQCIERSGWSEHVVVQSFSPVICAAVHAEAPHLTVAMLGSAETAIAWSRLYALGRICGCHGINLCARDVTRAHVEAVHHLGKTMAAWTLDEEEEMERLARWGVDAIITNRPDVCRRVLDGLG